MATQRKRRPVRKSGHSAIQLRIGNETITVDKEHLLEKIVEFLPGSKILLEPKNDIYVNDNTTGSADGIHW